MSSATSLIRKPVVRARVGLSDVTIWRLVRDGKFPRPIRIGKRAIAWKSTDIEAWINARPEAA